MRAWIASLLIVCSFLFLGGTACQQNQDVEIPQTSAETVAVSEIQGKKIGEKRPGLPAPRAEEKEQSAAPTPASVAAAKAAAASIAPRKPGLRVSRVQAPGMYVALTFDDGPSSAYTPKVLDILKRHGAKGTFFVLGSNAQRCSSIIARAAAEGHEIGVHTWSHINMVRSSMDKIDREVSRTAMVIRSITGKSPAVMRPPYGAVNARIVNHMYDCYGMRSILWDVDTQDWKHPGVSTVINRAVNGAKPGSIILVHDIHGSTLAAIEGIVTGLQNRGYTLVTVSELMARAGAHAAPKIPVTPQTENVTPANPVTAQLPEESTPDVASSSQQTPEAVTAPSEQAEQTITPTPEGTIQTPENPDGTQPAAGEMTAA